MYRNVKATLIGIGLVIVFLTPGAIGARICFLLGWDLASGIIAPYAIGIFLYLCWFIGEIIILDRENKQL